MRTTRLMAVLAALAAVGTVAADAFAYYHPTMGRFMQRDPGAGGAQRIGAGGPAVATRRFIPRDPTGSNQYADGVNLYQYVQSSPTVLRDPSGLIIVAKPNLGLHLQVRFDVMMIAVSPSTVKPERCEYSSALLRVGQVNVPMVLLLPPGRLDSEIVARMLASPHKFYVKDGELKNLEEHVTVRKAIVGRAVSARERNKKGLWKLKERNKLPAGMWWQGMVRPGKSLTAAVYCPWNTPTETGCTLALSFIVGAGIVEGRGMTDDDLEKDVYRYPDVIGGKAGHPLAGARDLILWITSGRHRAMRQGRDMIPGDWTYVKNNKVKRAALDSGYNFVRVGDGKIICFGMDPISYAEARSTYAPPDYEWSDTLSYPRWGLEEPWND